MCILKYLLLTQLTFIICNTQAIADVTWKENGSISNVAGNTIQLNIHSAYDSLTYAGSTYVLGFNINAEGNNYPYIARVNDELTSIRYWAVEQIPQDIFVYQQRVYFNTRSGRLFSLADEKWQLEKERFPENSQVIFSNETNELIVCFHAGSAKTDSHRSGCLSTGKGWNIDFNWFRSTPKVCNHVLFAIEEKQKNIFFNTISMKTGEVLSSAVIHKIPDDICQLK